MDSSWKPYKSPTTWSREGHTFMSHTTIENLLRNTEVDFHWWDIIDHNLAWLSSHKDNNGNRMYAVQGGIGAFLEDCRAAWSLLALQSDPVLPSKV